MSLGAAHGFDSVLWMNYVLEPAARSLALAGAVWLLLAALRVRDVSFRLAAWTVVLYAALAMPLVGGMLPEVPLLIPVEQTAQPVTMTLPASSVAAAARATAPAVARAGAGASIVFVSAKEKAGDTAPITVNPGRREATIPWLALAAGIYCVIAGILLGRFGLGVALSRRVRRASRPIVDQRIGEFLAREAGKAGLRKAPRIAQSPALSIPATMGVLHPIILFPEGWSEWSETQISAVLAHELSHIARRDALTQALSRVHRAFFWFSPLSWWLDRALVDLAEQASDDAALRAGTDRARYAEVLLAFFRALNLARGRVRWQAVSMAQGARSARRLERILSGARLSRRLGQTALAAVGLAVVPLVCLAAAVRPSLTPEVQLPAPPTAPAPPSPPAFAGIPVATGQREAVAAKTKPEVAAVKAPERELAGLSRAVSAPGPVLVFAPRAFATPRVLSATIVPPARGWFFAQQKQTITRDTAVRIEARSLYFNSSNCSDQVSFAIVSGGRFVTVYGCFTDMVHIRELQNRISGSFLWFRKNGRSYIVRDPATVKAAFEAFASQETLAREQAEISPAQAEYAAALGQTRARLSVPDLSAEMRQLEAEMQHVEAAMHQFNSSPTQAEMKRAHEKIEEALKTLNSSAAEQLGEVQAQTAEAIQALNSSGAMQELRQAQEAMVVMQQMQRQINSLQTTAIEKQARIARQQAKLAGQEAERAQEAAAQVRRLIERAIARGLAQPE